MRIYSQSGSRKEKHRFTIPLLKVGLINTVMFGEEGNVTETGVAGLGSCHNPPFLASLSIDIRAESIAVDVP